MNLLRKIVKGSKLLSLRIQGFKSLRDVEINFPKPLTMVIGPNGSGKTAIVEAIELLYYLLEYRRGRVINPFSKWWGYHNISWRHREGRPIKFTLVFDNFNLKEVINREVQDAYEKEFLINIFKYMDNKRIEFWVEVEGAGTEIFLREGLSFKDLGFDIRFEGKRAKISINDPISFQENIIHPSKNILSLRLLKSFPDKKPFDVAPFISDEEYEKIKAHIRKLRRTDYIVTIFNKVKEAETYVLDLVHKAEFDTNVSGVFEGFDYIVKDLQVGVMLSDTMEAQAFELSDNIKKEIQLKFSRTLRLKSWKESPESRLLSKLIYGWLLYKVIDKLAFTIVAAYALVGSFINGIIVLKTVDLKELRSLKPLLKYERLNADAGNLISMLYLLGQGRLPEEVIMAIKILLDQEEIAGYFEPTPDGRVVLKLVVEDLELLPVGIPDGVWKVMAIEVALLLNPSLIVVDEFENHLHAKAQEYLLDEFRNSGSLAIITTHSPVPVDSARSLDEILLLELKDGETRATRLADDKSLREKLSNLGLTPSEALYYGFMEGENG